jgi:hypothetical protein
MHHGGGTRRFDLGKCYSSDDPSTHLLFRSRIFECIKLRCKVIDSSMIVTWYSPFQRLDQAPDCTFLSEKNGEPEASGSVKMVHVSGEILFAGRHTGRRTFTRMRSSHSSFGRRARFLFKCREEFPHRLVEAPDVSPLRMVVLIVKL